MLRSLKGVLRFKRFEKNPAQRRLNKAANIAVLRTIAHRRLPGGVFDYIDGAAEDERTSRDNASAFSNYKFKIFTSAVIIISLSEISTKFYSANIFESFLIIMIPFILFFMCYLFFKNKIKMKTL